MKIETSINNSVSVEQVKGQTVAGPKNSTPEQEANNTKPEENRKTEHTYKGKIINTTA